MEPERDFRHLEEIASKLMGTEVRLLTPLSAGRNNRGFAAETANGPIFVKHYFRHPGEQRNRIASEFSFSKAVWAQGIRSIAEPIAADFNNDLACYAWLDAQPFSGVVTEDRVRQAAHFLSSINEDRLSAGYAQLLEASEAAFSGQTHFESVRRRVAKLASASPPSTLANQYRQVALESLPNLLSSYREWSNFDYIAPGRFLSPSDFGFHNVLCGINSSIFFVDFEYAGWDDPVRTTCDFFLQPRYQVPESMRDTFIAEAFKDQAIAEKVRQMYPQLWPLCALRWCCILLNPFLAVDSSRRAFSGYAPSLKTLQKALNDVELRAQHIAGYLL